MDLDSSGVHVPFLSKKRLSPCQTDISWGLQEWEAGQERQSSAGDYACAALNQEHQSEPDMDLD